MKLYTNDETQTKPSYDELEQALIVADTTIVALRQQLAVMTAERDDLLDNLSLCKGNELAEQLAASQARCAEMEEALNACLDDLKQIIKNNQGGYAGDNDLVRRQISLLSQVFTPTERPPA